MFKLTTSAGNSLEQPIRPGERFAGVMALDIPRPMQVSQVVLEFTATERWLPGSRGIISTAPGTKFTNSPMLAASLVVWKALQKGVTASTVLSDGMHVFNFSCQIPHLNYPQSIKRAEYEVVYMLEGKVLAPKDNGDEHVVAMVEKELFFSPLVAYRPSADLPLSMAETLCYEKKGKKGKPAIELRALLSSRQIIAGSKLKIELSIKELTSSSWTKIVARLFERTVCRDESTTREPPAAPPLWSTECELASTELVRSSVYNFFLTDDITGTSASEKKTANGETVTSELLVFPIPMISCSPLDSEHLDFLHYISLEVYLPGWLSSDRYVHIEFPVQLVTCELSTAAAHLQSHQTPLASSDRNKQPEGDELSIMSGKSGNSARPLSTRSGAERSVMTAHSIPIVLAALPPRYCDVHQAQRPAPTLQLVKQVNASSTSNASTYDGSTASIPDLQLPRRLSRQSQSNSHRTTMSSAHSMDMKSLMVGLGIAEEKGEERYRSRPLPMAPVPEQDTPAPPPLPAAPMPSSDSAISLTRPLLNGSRAASPLQSPRPDQAYYSFLQSYPKGNALPNSEPSSPTTLTIRHGQSTGNAATSMNSDTSSPGTYARKQRQSSAGSTGASDSSHLRMPISPAYNESMNVGGVDSDDDAGYFKSSIARKSMEREKVSEKGLFRLRKNSSIKHIGQ
ncbi:hypothetical protein IW152_001357 [Coemansia sp. BCRC 34962]|nr:hypothetical protein IW152_001357 [Coemansia sp. BCRC 34962]